jgi:hypothetical protein
VRQRLLVYVTVLLSHDARVAAVEASHPREPPPPQFDLLPPVAATAGGAGGGGPAWPSKAVGGVGSPWWDPFARSRGRVFGAEKIEIDNLEAHKQVNFILLL